MSIRVAVSGFTLLTIGRRSGSPLWTARKAPAVK